MAGDAAEQVQLQLREGSADHAAAPHRVDVSPEATTYTPFYPNAISTIVWRVPVNSKLLLDTGFMSYVQDWDERRQINPQVGFDTISVTEDSTGQIYRASTVYGHNFDNPLTLRSSAAYVTGTHSYKTGFMLRVRGNGPTWNNIDVNGNMNYNFLNGVPRSITLFATPIEQQNDVNADLGIFAQDSWAMSRMTINYGMRYDYLHASVPAQHLAAGPVRPRAQFRRRWRTRRSGATSTRASACRTTCSARQDRRRSSPSAATSRAAAWRPTSTP